MQYVQLLLAAVSGAEALSSDQVNPHMEAAFNHFTRGRGHMRAARRGVERALENNRHMQEANRMGGHPTEPQAVEEPAAEENPTQEQQRRSWMPFQRRTRSEQPDDSDDVLDHAVSDEAAPRAASAPISERTADFETRLKAAIDSKDRAAAQQLTYQIKRTVDLEDELARAREEDRRFAGRSLLPTFMKKKRRGRDTDVIAQEINNVENEVFTTDPAFRPPRPAVPATSAAGGYRDRAQERVRRRRAANRTSGPRSIPMPSLPEPIVESIYASGAMDDEYEWHRGEYKWHRGELDW